MINEHQAETLKPPRIRIVGKPHQILAVTKWLSGFTSFGEALRAYKRWWGAVNNDEELARLNKLTGKEFSYEGKIR